jgi:hypothetical protein
MKRAGDKAADEVKAEAWAPMKRDSDEPADEVQGEEWRR